MITRKEARCIDCIYGGQKKFRSAAYMKNEVLKRVNYIDGEYGCRAAFFASKEEVCLNNSFSEFKEA